MQRLGQAMNPRDERGWMIPREGTKRRMVYDALVAGKTVDDIMQEARLSRAAYANHRYFITEPEKAQASSYAAKNPDRVVRTIKREDFVHG